MKRITLSILQFDADVKAGNFEGIKRFIDEFEPLYTSLFVRYKYSESEFKKEVQEVFEFLFIYDGIDDYAFRNFKKENGAIPIIQELNPIFKRLEEIKRKYFLIDRPFMQGIRLVPDPLMAFVTRYQGRYEENGLSDPEKALISVYEGEIIKRGQKLYGDYIYYSKRKNRTAMEVTRRKTLNKIERIEKIIPYLSKNLQSTANDEVSILKARLEEETF